MELIQINRQIGRRDNISKHEERYDRPAISEPEVICGVPKPHKGQHFPKRYFFQNFIKFMTILLNFFCKFFARFPPISPKFSSIYPATQKRINILRSLRYFKVRNQPLPSEISNRLFCYPLHSYFSPYYIFSSSWLRPDKFWQIFPVHSGFWYITLNKLQNCQTKKLCIRKDKT